MAAPIINMGPRFAERERSLDRRVQLVTTRDNEDSNLTDSQYIEKLKSFGFVTQDEFELLINYITTFLTSIQEKNDLLFKENEEYKKKLSYLEDIVQKYFFEKVYEKSHKNTILLRQALKLPEIKDKIDDNIIEQLDGILEDLLTENKNAVDVLHEVRGE